MVRTIEGITEFQFENGLKLLVFPDQSKPTVTMNLTLFVGSRHEGYGEAGMAHLLEHMVFKGTPTHEDIPKLLKDRGAQFNGTTWLDRTNYYETMPASGDNLEFAIKLEADRMINSRILAEDLKSEMTVVRNEFERGENSPSRILEQRIVSSAFEWHNYGQSTIGNRADIERVPVENLRRFYRKYYQPDNAMVVIAGKFNPIEAIKMVAKHFGTIPRPERILENTYTEEPAQDGERMVTLRRVGDVALVGAAYHVCSGPHPDYVAVDVLSHILATDESGRLYKALVKTKRAAGVYGYAYALHDPGLLQMYARVATGNAPETVLTGLIDTIEEVVESGVTKEEVGRAISALLKQRELQAANSGRLAVDLSEWAAQGDWRMYFLYRDRLEKVTVEDVQRVAKKYLKQSNRTVGMFIPTESPEKTVVPATPSLAEMIGDYKGRKDIAMGEQFDVSPANIDARTKRSELPGGIKVSLLPKKTRGESVTLQLTLRYGDRNSLQNLASAAAALPQLMMRGTKTMSRQEIRDTLDQLRSRMSANGGPGAVAVSVTSKRENLAKVLDLLRKVLREPALKDEELELMKRERLAQLAQQLKDPGALAQTAVQKTISPYPKGDPLYTNSIAEEIESLEALTTSDLRTIYDSLLNGQNGELTVVGDFDEESTMQGVQAILNDWTSSTNYQRLVNRGDFDVKGETKTINTPGKANATYFAGTVLPMRDDHPDYPALLIGNSILGGGSLSSRLGDRVRQKEGLSYGVGSGLRASALDERATFYVFAISNPDNGQKLRKVIREEMDLILKDGVTKDEVDTAIQGYLQSQQVGRTRDRSLASALATNARVGRTMKFTAELESRVRALTVDQVNAALRKYINPDKIVVVHAGDFEKDAKSGSE